MASITFNVNDDDVPRIVQAFEIAYGAKQPEETNAQFVKRHIILSVDRFVKDSFGTKARRDSLAEYVDLDIT